MREKIEFTNEEKHVMGSIKARRIRALVDIPRFGVKAGDTGGFMQFKENLDPESNAWIGENAVVYGLNTLIRGDAVVSGQAVVGEGCIIDSGVTISGKAKVVSTHMRGKDIYVGDKVSVESSTIEGGDILLIGHALLSNMRIGEFSRSVYIQGQANIVGNMKPVKIEGQNILIDGKVLIVDVEKIYGKRITILDEAVVKTNVSITGADITIRDAAVIEGAIDVCDKVLLKDCAHVYNRQDDDESIPAIGNMTVGNDIQKSVQELKAVK